MNEHAEYRYPAEPSPQPRELHPLEDLALYLREYARERPEVVALTCFSIGFILGWKLKPW